MSESNKEKFNDLITQIMSKLIDACPTPIGLSAEDFGFPAGRLDPHDGYYVETSEESFLNACVRWLKEEELIRGGDEYVVTGHGLEVFDSLPACLNMR
ncbi:hypothetical protein FBY06_114101 [Pseudomonas sp. SJZ085]|uniref:hypothetical protein n=1 Tax=unclassified Pseudomonas TaxID=196821 RepID=UPI00119A6A26|nr:MULTISPECIES: hypothetical protein [unclassified Pseudomonas]TWC18643.1 hypothetical protein FBX99_114101 [Pseudomonas sp. SJZ074]TWC36426.1 hypothetical protein FBY06_114101 [Pseudomonas sp. SJZ085]